MVRTSDSQIEENISRILGLLSPHEVLLESMGADACMSNIKAVIEGTQPAKVYASLGPRWSRDKEINQIIYGREIVSPKDDHPAKMRLCAELVVPIHHCAETLGLQANIDYDGRIMGRYPAVTLGGNYEASRTGEVIELIRTADNLIGFYQKIIAS